MNREATLGGTVRDRRLALGYSLGQLATKVNKTAASIRSWERGETLPTEEETAALSNALDLDGDLLLALRKASLAAASAAAPIPVEPPVTELADVDVDDPWGAESVAHGEAPEEVEAGASELSGQTPEQAAEIEALEALAAVDAGATVIAAPGAEADAAEDVDHLEDHADIDSETQGGEALVDTVAALAAAEFAEEDKGADSDTVDADRPGMPDREAPLTGPAATDPAMHEAMTEAVPVVPSGAVAVAGAAPEMRSVASEPYATPRSANPVVQVWDNVVDTYHRLFDPRRKWIYRVRWVLLLIAFYFMLRVLGWAGGELWEAIGDVLDGIAFTPSETPDVSN